eukprot:747032-Amphidinium_carterae.1
MNADEDVDFEGEQGTAQPEEHINEVPPTPPVEAQESPPQPVQRMTPVEEESFPSLRVATAEAKQLMQKEFVGLLSLTESYQNRLEICTSVIGKARHDYSVARSRLQVDLGFDQAETATFMS